MSAHPPNIAHKPTSAATGAFLCVVCGAPSTDARSRRMCWGCRDVLRGSPEAARVQAISCNRAVGVGSLEDHRIESALDDFVRRVQAERRNSPGKLEGSP